MKILAGLKKLLQSTICDYDYYKDKINLIKYEHGKQIKEYDDELTEERHKKEVAEKALKEALKKPKPFNILDLKSWYYERFSRQGAWYYNAYSTGLREVSTVISAGDQKVVKDAAKELINFYELKKGEVSPEVVIQKVAEYFMRRQNWTYVTDIQMHGVIEFWNNAADSWKKRRGDCDSLSILMHNLIFYMFKELDLNEHYWRLKFTAHGTLVEAHAFNIWLGEDGEWYVLESTLDLRGSFAKTWLKTPMRNNNLYTGRPWGFSDRDKSWRGLNNSLQPYRNDGDMK